MIQWIDRNWHLLFSRKRISTISTNVTVRYNDIMSIENGEAGEDQWNLWNELNLHRYLGKGYWLKLKK